MSYNIVQDLQRAIHRVEQLYASLEGAKLDEARKTVAYAQQSLARNYIEEMKQSIWDLDEITVKPKKP